MPNPSEPKRPADELFIQGAVKNELKHYAWIAGGIIFFLSLAGWVVLRAMATQAVDQAIKPALEKIERAKEVFGKAEGLGKRADELQKIVDDGIDGLIKNPQFTKRVADSLEPLPIGTVIAFAGKEEPPGWKFCNGQWLDSSTPEGKPLFEVIRFTYGQQELRFRLPDLRGRTPIGAGQGKNKDDTDLTLRNVGDTGGEEKHKLIVSELPAHTHSNKYAIGNGPGSVQSGSNMTGTSSNTDSTGGNEPHNIMQPFLVVNFIIKIK